MANDTALSGQALTDRIWHELALATRQRGHEWRTPVLATVDAAQQPQARTVVMRGADAQRWQLRAFTDARSPKARELRERPEAVLVFWSTALNWQLRVSVKVEVMDRGDEVDAAWARMSSSVAARDYLAPAAPGQPLALSGEHLVAPGEGHHLAVMVAQVRAIDWLELGGVGEHQRCWITPEGVQRLVP